MDKNIIKITIESIIKKYNLFSFNMPLIEKDDYIKFNNAVLDFYISYIFDKLNKCGIVRVDDNLVELKEYGVLIKTKEFEEVIYF
jgi:hypothetical protein